MAEANSEMVYVTGSDDFGWSWKRVDADGVTVAEGKTTLADEALRAASRLAAGAARPARRERALRR